jgi:hypothetical protein
MGLTEWVGLRTRRNYNRFDSVDLKTRKCKKSTVRVGQMWAKERIQAASLLDRCTLVAGSFFESVPEGADAYVLRHIIHDWDEEKCLTILRNCHRAMRPDSKLLVIESVIPAGNVPFHGKFLDLVMLLIPGGKERTESEYRALFEHAGFELTRIVPTGTEVSVVEGKKQ